MNEAELDDIEARANAASPGPWSVLGLDLIESRGVILAEAVAIDGGESNAAFIAAARTDIPALVAEVRRLRARILDAWLALPSAEESTE